MLEHVINLFFKFFRVSITAQCYFIYSTYFASVYKGLYLKGLIHYSIFTSEEKKYKYKYKGSNRENRKFNPKSSC